MAHVQVTNQLLELSVLESRKENKLRLNQLLLVLVVPVADELLDLLDCLHAVKTRHYEIGQDVRDLEPVLKELRNL